MQNRVVAACVIGVGAAVVIGCAADGPVGYPDGIFQIADVSAAPETIRCVQSSSTLYHVQLNVKLVNTTDADITVLTVRSEGIVIRGSRNGDVGKQAQHFDSLEFSPKPMIVRAHDKSGTAILAVTMEPACGLLDPQPGCTVGQSTPCNATVGGYKDVQASLYVRTTTGEYATKPVVTRVNYSF